MEVDYQELEHVIYSWIWLVLRVMTWFMSHNLNYHSLKVVKHIHYIMDLIQILHVNGQLSWPIKFDDLWNLNSFTIRVEITLIDVYKSNSNCNR